MPSTKMEKNQNYQLSVYPNPFTSVVSVQCSGISEGQKISLQIYDLSGRLVKSFSLITNHLPLTTAVSWDGRDNNGKEVKSGVYFYTIKAGNDFQATQKLILIR
jgi:flagellar hook assembly protein FlgD